MSANIDERIVSIKFDNSGFSQKISETQNDLEEFNKSLSFDGIKKGVETITEGFKNISVEAKKADLSPMAESIDKVEEKFKVLETIAVGALLKIGAQAVELGEKLVKSLTIDRLAEGYKKYESILTSQMTLTAALGGKTEEEVAQNAEKIERVLKQLTWYADETSYSLNDMIGNVSKFANYGIDLDKAKTAMMGIANASAKSGAPIANASHAMEGFSKAMGQGYMSYQVWRTWMTSAQIGTVDFKNTFLETAKTMIKEGKSLGDTVRLVGDDLEYYAGKAEGWKKITEGTFEESLTKGRWMNTDVMLQGLSKYSAAMDDLYNQSQAVGKSVTEILESGAEGFDQFSVEAFKYGQQCKTLSDVFDSLFDATSTTWYRIFQALIGDYKQTVDLWSSFAEYIFEWFVYPLQSVADAIEDFSVKNSNIINKMTGEYMTMREVIVGSFTNILEAIKSVVDPIKEAFNAIFRPAEELPDKIQNGIEKFYDFTKGLKLTGEQVEKLKTTFLNIFQVIKTVINAIKTVIKLLKDTLYPVVKKVGEFAVTIITTVFKALYKLASWISSFISKVFGVRDVVADMKNSVIEAAESFDKISDSAERSATSMQQTASEYSEVTSSLEDVTEGANDAVAAMEELGDAAENTSKKAKKAYKVDTKNVITEGYDGTYYLDYIKAQNKANNKALAELIEKYDLSQGQYDHLIKYMQEEDAGHIIDIRDISSNLDINKEAVIELMSVLHNTTSAVKTTDRIMKHSLKNGEDVYEEYETIYDGIRKAQEETLITEADNAHIVNLYFNQGVKDYEKLARAIDGEIWKVKEVIEAYEEAYKIEQYLNKNKLEATKENIQLAREELGYIKKSAEEADKKHQEEKKRRQELYQWQKFSFKERERSTSKEFKKIDDISNQIAWTSEYARTELTNKWNHEYSLVEEEAEDVAKSVENIADASESVTKKISNNAGQMADAFKTVSEEAQTASESVTKGVQTMSDELQATSSGTSYADRVKKMFEDLDDSSLLDGFTGTVKEKVTGITDWLKGVKERILQGFAKIGDEFSHFLDHPIETIKNVIGIIKKLITGIWQKQDSKGTGVAGASVVLDEEELKVTLSEKIKMVLTGVLYDIKKFLKEKLGDKGFDSLTDVLKKIMDFKDKVVKYFNRIKDAINVVFGEGSVWDKLSNSTLWQPFVDAIDSIITKFDNLTIGIGKVKDAIETRFGGAFDQASENIHAHIENIRGWFKGLKDELDDFSQKVAIAKGEYIANDGEFESDWSKPVQIAAEIQTKVGDAWAKVKEKAQDVIDWFKDLDWQDILKIEALTSVVGQIAGIITRTWIGLNIAGMAKDIGGFFDNLSNGLSNLASAIGDKESLGTTLLKIAGGISLLAASIFLLSTIDSTAMENAVKTIKDLAIIIGVLVGVVALCVRLMNKGNKVLDFKGKSLPEMVGESLSTIFGSKNTMADMAKVIVGIGAGILLLSAAFAIILEATKDANPTQVAVAIGVLVGISVIVGLLFAAVFAMMQKINTIHSDALVVIKQHSVIDSLAEMLKWFAVAIAALVAALLTVKKVIEDCYDESGDLNEQKLVLILAIFTVLALLPVAVMATISKMAEGLQQHNVDPKLVDSLKTSLSSVMRSTVMLASAFKSILKAIDSVENPDSVGKAMQTMLLLCGFMLIMIIVMGIMAAIFTGKASITDLAEANKLSGSTAKGIDIEGAKGLKIQNAKDISPALTAMGKVVIEIAIALKLMASAFQTIVTAVDKATDEKVFGRVIGVAIGMFAAMALLILELGIIAKKLDGIEINGIKVLGNVVLEIAASLVLVGLAMKMLVGAFDDSNTKAVNKAIATAGIFIGAVIILFGILAGLSMAGEGAALKDAAKILEAIAIAMLAISASVYILAKGLQEMTIAMSMLAESGKDFIAVLETIRDAMPIIKDIIVGAIKALIVGIVQAVAESISDIIDIVVEGFTKILESIAEHAPRILEAFRTIQPMLVEIASGLMTIIFEALNNAWPKIEEFLDKVWEWITGKLLELFDWLKDEGIPKLEEIIFSLVQFLTEEVLPQLKDTLFGLLLWLQDDIVPGLIGVLKVLWTEVEKFITETVFPGLENIWDSLLTLIGDFIEDLHNHTVDWANELIDWVVDLIKTIESGVNKISDAIESLLTTIVDNILKLFKTGGKLLAKLILIPKYIYDGFCEEIRNQFGLSKDGKATTSGAIFTAGKNIIQGLIDGIKSFMKDIASLAKDLAKRFLDALRGKDGLDEHSPSKATEKIGRFAGMGFVNGVKESSRDVANSAITMAEAFMNPMASELEAFSVTTSSLIGQLIDANLDANPVITPVIDMTNFDRAQESMSSFFDSQKALDVATSFSTMKAAEDLAKINQNGSTDTEPVAPVYNYTQNNYSPKALDPIEIYRRTHNQLKFAQSLNYGNTKGWA